MKVKAAMGKKVVVGALVMVLGWWGWLALAAGGSVDVRLGGDGVGITITAGDEER